MVGMQLIGANEGKTVQFLIIRRISLPVVN